MNKATEPCRPEWIDLFVNDQLSSADERLFVQHLDQCSHCQERVEQSTADHLTWSSVSDFLKDDAHDISHVLGNESKANSKSSQGEIQNVLDLLGPTDDPQMLGRLAGYEVSGVIGCGGMSVVLKGFDRSLDRVVAIKVLAPRLASSGAARFRFEREAKATAAVLHPNVIAIHGVSNSPPLPHLVMPYIKGESLEKRISRQGPLPLREVLRIGSQLAAGLAAAHAQGLIHRDIKPANVLLESGVERVHVTDFGLARAADDASITQSGMIAGTPQYMSPEQARGDAIDWRSDLFSLGSVLYAMSVGHPPFRAETAFGLLQKINQQPHRSVRESQPDLPDWFERLIHRLLAKDPTDRFASATDVQQILEQCLAHCEQPDRVDLPKVLSVPRNHWRFHMSLSLATIALTAAVAIYGPWNSMPVAPANDIKALIQELNEQPPSELLQPLEQNDQELLRIQYAIQQLEHDISETQNSLSKSRLQSAPQE